MKDFNLNAGFYMSMIKAAILMGFALISAVAFSQHPVAGKYHVVSRTFFQRLFGPLSGYKSRIVGSELSLNADSGFEYKSCGNEMKGTWTINGDSVFLHIKQNELRSDSLKNLGKMPIIPDQPVVFRLWKKKPGRVVLFRGFDWTIELMKQEG